MLEIEKKSVIAAIHQLNDKATVADVVTRTGFSQDVVQRLLNQVAADTQGQICVSGTGDIFYQFAANFESRYESDSLSSAINAFSAKVLEALFLLFRVSFGLALILSLTVIVLIFVPFATYFRMMGGWSSRKDDKTVIKLEFVNKLHFDRDTLKTLVFWNTNQGKNVDGKADQNQTPNLLLNCFAFLFGEGDPNWQIDEKRWQLIAQTIRHNNFALTAEQLAPFTEKSGDDSVLPVLVRFNGKPEVTEAGDIVYVFDSLQSLSLSETEATEPTEPFLQESHWIFSSLPPEQLTSVLLIAGANIFGAALLYQVVTGLGLMQMELGQLVKVLLAYAAFFMWCPMLRVGLNICRNQVIDARNEERQQLARNLETPNAALSSKLQAARHFQIAPRLFNRADIIYDSNREMLNQSD
ncbi:MAG: hypothetical protein P4L53_18185 [Candidatus Obscuribacterales bacterium]|nr:hypothetical protein [Candidatus Obscuribacterales bacterium]